MDGVTSASTRQAKIDTSSTLDLDQFRNFPPGQEPDYDEVARYVFYTETSQRLDETKVDKKTGKIGEHK